jgi:oligopeptidase B
MIKFSRLPLALVVLAGCSTLPVNAPDSPPVAKKIPRVTMLHGERLADDYFWMRQKESRAVLNHLRAENAYTDFVMEPTLPLQKRLYQEMLRYLQATDRSVAYRDGDWFRYYRTEADKQYPIYCRKKLSLSTAEEVVLDLNALAAGKQYIDLGGHEYSDDGNWLAYSVDETGFQEYTLFVKDLRTGALLPDRITNVAGFVWAADNRTIFCLTEDSAKRAHRVWRHELGAKSDVLVYEEKDELFSLGIGRSRSKSYIFVAAASKNTTEYRCVRADQPTTAWRVIAPRQLDHKYDVDHAGDLFYIRTNDAGSNYRLVTAPVADTRREAWKELVPHRMDVSLDDVTLFSGHVVLHERANGLPTLRVLNLRSNESRTITVPDPTYSLYASENAVFHTNVFRYGYASLRVPDSVYDYDMEAGKSVLLKQRPVPGFDPDQFETKRILATATDGTRIPISYVQRKGEPVRALLLDGYGAYGLANDVWFSTQRLCLLNRGVAFAVAHVRGGGEFGQSWYDAGRLRNKRNTFTDFIACADHLVREGYVSREKLGITGASAGGLTMATVLNMRPDICRAALIEVPFVDVINTMLDESLPLTVGEFEEWGNPKVKADYEYIRRYSPYENLSVTNYPAMLVKTSLNDSRVMYWEPAKYVAKLRTLKTDSNPLLLQTELDPAGHGGRSGRYDAMKDIAFDYAFLLTAFGW